MERLRDYLVCMWKGCVIIWFEKKKLCIELKKLVKGMEGKGRKGKEREGKGRKGRQGWI